MAGKPRILCLCEKAAPDAVPPALQESCDLVTFQSPLRAIASLTRTDAHYDGVFVMGSTVRAAARIGQFFQHDVLLEGMADGLVLLDADNTILWANQRLHQWTGRETLAGLNFYQVLGSPEILGPDFCPFHMALATGRASCSTLRLHESKYYQVHAAPVLEEGAAPEHLIVTIRDVTEEILQQQKMAAIHKAGLELSDLKPSEIHDMTVDDRIELLKSNILHHTQDLLHYDVVEIRLLDQCTGKLEPLLAVGIDPGPAQRPLRADTRNNGVTGFVAATGKSYLCEDATEDPLYLEGFKGARSSLTVPLMLHDQVIGTFNVESPETQAFGESDLQFLEIFARDIAVALNTLELLVAQRANTAHESVEAIHSAVALPVDEILNDAVNVMERYIGHDSELRDQMERIVRNARDIKRVIQRVGQSMAPVEAVPASVKIEPRPKLRGRHVLVVDADESVRNDAHALLERYGCNVETAHNGQEAVCMVRNSGLGYDVIISDIRLPDHSGYRLMCRLQDLTGYVPLVLMTGFGYDPGHSIVKARQAGLHPKAILYKPFRLDQLLETVELILDTREQQIEVQAQCRADAQRAAAEGVEAGTASAGGGPSA